MRKITYTILIALASVFTCIYSIRAQTTNRFKGFFEGSTYLQNFVFKNQYIFSSSENDKNVHLVATDFSMVRKWEQHLAGSLIFAGALKSNIVVVVSTDYKQALGGDNSTYKAYVVDPANGKLIGEKIIYNGNNDYKTIPQIQISKNKDSFTLFARETGFKRSVKIVPGGMIGSMIASKKFSDDANKIRMFSVSTFNEKLESLDKVIPFLPAGDFVGAAKTPNGDLYVALTEEKKGVTIAKYDAGKDKVSSSVFEAIDHSSGFLGDYKLNEDLNIMTDTLNNNVVYLTGAFSDDNQFKCIFYKYDFAGKNHKRFTKSFKRAEFKALEKSYKPINKEFKSLELGSTKSVEIQQVFCTPENYMLAIGDIHFVPATMGSNLPSTYRANGLLLYTLDLDLKEKSLSTIPREYEHIVKPDFNAYFRDNSWNIFASEYMKGRFLISKVNASSGAVEAIKLIEPEKADKSDRPYLDEMIITDQHIVVPLLDYKMSFSLKPKNDVNLYQIKW